MREGISEYCDGVVRSTSMREIVPVNMVPAEEISDNMGAESAGC